MLGNSAAIIQNAMCSKIIILLFLLHKHEYVNTTMIYCPLNTRISSIQQSITCKILRSKKASIIYDLKRVLCCRPQVLKAHNVYFLTSINGA